jgi:hypothetical protein
MRSLIAGMKASLDRKMEGPDGGGMYPGYEQYWSAIQREPR